jgi:hypothetical protein
VGKLSAGNTVTVFLVLLSGFISYYPFSVFSQENNQSAVTLDYQVATWQGFKKSAFTITFDDNYRFQVTLAAPLLNQHNYKATYFLVTNRIGKGWCPGWDTVNMLAAQGHEIASHSKNHANFAVLSQHPEWADSMIHELRDSRDSINARVPSQQCETFAWPSGSVDTTSINLAMNYYMACRGTENYFNGKDPANFYNIYSQHIYHDTPLDEVNGFIDTIVSRGGWLVERWHGFRLMHDTNGYEPVPIGEFADHLTHVAENQNNLWITTMDSVVKYIRERDAAILYLIDSTTYKVVFNLTDNLQDIPYPYKVPLTVKIRMYPCMTNVYQITQGSRILPFRFTWHNGITYMVLSAVPHDSLIIMHIPDPAGTPGFSDLKDHARVYPNPFRSNATIVFDMPQAEFADIRVYDRFGRQTRDYSKIYPAGRNNIELDGTGMPPGIYECLIILPGRRMDLRLVRFSD